jgi:hypothetical protein
MPEHHFKEGDIVRYEELTPLLYKGARNGLVVVVSLPIAMGWFVVDIHGNKFFAMYSELHPIEEPLPSGEEA